MNIRTKWHVLKELLKQGEVYSPAPRGEKALAWDDIGWDIGHILVAISEADSMPKFVFDLSLMELITDKEFRLSLLDMKKAGVLKLPYKDIVVEFPASGKGSIYHRIVILSEASEIYANDVMGMSFTLNRDEHGDYLTVAGSVSGLTITEGVDKDAWLRIEGHVAKWVPSKSPVNDDLIKKTYEKDSSNVAIAWYLVALVMSTKGVQKDVINPEKLNKQRVKSGKPSVPTHTYLRIGHVYQRDGSSVKYDERKSPRPHWRRGHIRNVRHGAGRKETRPVWIEPMLVAFQGDEVLKAEYHVKT